jgi:hypothetical protein
MWPLGLSFTTLTFLVQIFPPVECMHEPPAFAAQNVLLRFSCSECNMHSQMRQLRSMRYAANLLTLVVLQLASDMLQV